jgi:hypothetical protein
MVLKNRKTDESEKEFDCYILTGNPGRGEDSYGIRLICIEDRLYDHKAWHYPLVSTDRRSTGPFVRWFEQEKLLWLQTPEFEQQHRRRTEELAELRKQWDEDPENPKNSGCYLP